MKEEIINELQICFRYKGYIRTGYLSIVFKKGEKVVVVNEKLEDRQEGGIIEKIISMETNKELEETEIGYKYLMKVKGIDTTKFPSWKKYYKKSIDEKKSLQTQKIRG